MKIAVVIITDNQELHDEQKQMLANEYENARFIFMPKHPTIITMREQLKEIRAYIDEQTWNHGVDVVFASSVPYMLKELTSVAYIESFAVKVFHNDNVEYKEATIPNASHYEQVPASTGWILI